MGKLCAPRLITISYRDFVSTSDCCWSHCDYFFILIPFFQTLGSLVWSGHKYVLFGWQGRSPRSIHRALWQGTIHNWGLKIYVRIIYSNYFVIFVNSHYLTKYRLYRRSKLSFSHSIELKIFAWFYSEIFSPLCITVNRF